MITVKLEVLLNTKTKTGYTGDSIKAKRNRYYVIGDEYFMELGEYDESVKVTDMVNVMRFSEDKLGLLNGITVYSDRYYPCGNINGKKLIHAYLLGRSFNNNNSMHVNHINGIICDNSSNNIKDVPRSENLEDRHIFTKETQFEIRTEKAMLQMIDILNSKIELTNCNEVIIKKNFNHPKRYSRNPPICPNDKAITVRDYFLDWEKQNPRKDISDKYKIIKRTKSKAKKGV